MVGKNKAELDSIIVKGAREHNLKNVTLELPKKKLIVFTGVSGSGKSSLAFDTIFAEGQRRYVESLSAYARQFIGQMEKPKYDTIKGLSPTISIEQKAASKNPRSTVGTITEIYDYLRVLFARVGEQYCIKCNKPVGRGSPEEMVAQIMSIPPGSKIMILAPIVENRKGEHRDRIDELKRGGFQRVRIDGVIQNIKDVVLLQKNKKHNIEVVVDRLVIKNGIKKRLIDSVEVALKYGHGQMIVHVVDREDLKMSESRSCCNIAYPELSPQLFSFNSPIGMCKHCNGIGTLLTIDQDKVVPDKNLSIKDGAIVPWRGYFSVDKDLDNSWGKAKIKAMQEQWGLKLDVPWKKLNKKIQKMILFGAQGQELRVDWQSKNFRGEVQSGFEGIVHSMLRRFKQTKSEGMKKWYGKFMSSKSCKACNGKRLKEEALHILIKDKSIFDVTEMTIGEACDFIKNLKFEGNRKLISNELNKEILSRLKFLVNVGLDYLSLNRAGPTLSGGESQRIRLASQIGSELTGVLYILDEPSIGLHQKDNKKLLQTLCHLRNIGNTLIVVEHDQETMETADWVVDIGPGAGHLGGQIVAEGTPEQIIKNPRSVTGRYLSGKEKISLPSTRRKFLGKQIIIRNANQNNLDNLTVKIPLGGFITITGVSGAGKSSLINQILYPALAQKLHDSVIEIGDHKSISGLEHLNKVININQKPIGRTPRSNPATYTKVFDYIRDLYALMPESRERGYKKGRFSFNVKGGRCEKCQGDGFIRVEMHFLADVFVPCESCKGRRFNDATLEVLFKGHSIADILDLSVLQAYELFLNQPKIKKILQTLVDVGLAYIKLGQSATTLSGGEAQRIKLARELAKAATGETLYLLDEPTTGLHFRDIKMLLKVLSRLVDAGNTVIVIEHNMDVIKCSDWIIDLGPDGGKAGGKIVAEGTPEDVSKIKGSYTGKYLKKVL
ncbi:MAG: excinuclease ABC subunit UvrA [Bacteriovoracaceae bacterium]|nr:excinuclease ABC subunit UvrA [Bacteriovoracaceae bacterium]